MWLKDLAINVIAKTDNVIGHKEEKLLNGLSSGGIIKVSVDCRTPKTKVNTIHFGFFQFQ